jgi:hypothetical protein
MNDTLLNRRANIRFWVGFTYSLEVEFLCL